MRRKLILIISDGGNGANRLPGVRVDEENYLNFFKSPEGGAWMEDEMIVYDHDNFAIPVLHDIDLTPRMNHTPIEYYLIVFCGHGFTDEQGRINLCVRPNHYVLLDELKATVEHARYLIIVDCCRTVERLNEARIADEMQVFAANEEARHGAYAERCRNLYNERLGLTPENAHMVLLSSSLGEPAGENPQYGGCYSYILLQSAKEKIGTPEERQDVYPIDRIHQLAEQEVISLSRDAQHPVILDSFESENRFPFVVVP